VVFTLKGRQCTLSKEDVEKMMSGVDPANGRNYFVVVNGRRYPAQQVLYLSLRGQLPGLSFLDFSSSDAGNILSQIGFEMIVER
jgi:hypothetical protein